VNLSMVLGAFIAGMLLADSEYRHQLEADIAPFKGLLLGLFFIAVGMSVNLGLLLEAPGRILLIVGLLMAAKAIVLFPLARLFGLCNPKGASNLAAAMSQGGEFAFVLFGIASRERILPASLVDELILAVAVTMLLTPIVYVINDSIGRRFDAAARPDYDEPKEQHHDVIIAGFGRVGQIVGRLLRMAGRPFTALEIDSSQVDVVRRYGNIVHYGDASRLDLLRAAGADHATVFVLAIDNMTASVRTAETVIRHFPNMKVIARARNRRHAHILMDLGIEHIFRETLLSSIALSKRVLISLGMTDGETKHMAETFRERDTLLLVEQHAIHHSEEQLVQSAKDTAAELESLLRNDSGKT
jgi:glutathione-regulated potassium-efflux system ancillary protein KefC/glutathione-regulated potassium-efflux system protein KefB